MLGYPHSNQQEVVHIYCGKVLMRQMISFEFHLVTLRVRIEDNKASGLNLYLCLRRHRDRFAPASMNSSHLPFIKGKTPNTCISD